MTNPNHPYLLTYDQGNGHGNRDNHHDCYSLIRHCLPLRSGVLPLPDGRYGQKEPVVLRCYETGQQHHTAMRYQSTTCIQFTTGLDSHPTQNAEKTANAYQQHGGMVHNCLSGDEH
jgi:hypothetical protein